MNDPHQLENGPEVSVAYADCVDPAQEVGLPEARPHRQDRLVDVDVAAVVEIETQVRPLPRRRVFRRTCTKVT